MKKVISTIKSNGVSAVANLNAPDPSSRDHCLAFEFKGLLSSANTPLTLYIKDGQGNWWAQNTGSVSNDGNLVLNGYISQYLTGQISVEVLLTAGSIGNLPPSAAEPISILKTRVTVNIPAVSKTAQKIGLSALGSYIAAITHTGQNGADSVIVAVNLKDLPNKKQVTMAFETNTVYQQGSGMTTENGETEINGHIWNGHKPFFGNKEGAVKINVILEIANGPTIRTFFTTEAIPPLD